jgi:hypothetical protein
LIGIVPVLICPPVKPASGKGSHTVSAHPASPSGGQEFDQKRRDTLYLRVALGAATIPFSSTIS